MRFKQKQEKKRFEKIAFQPLKCVGLDFYPVVQKINIKLLIEFRKTATDTILGSIAHIFREIGFVSDIYDHEARP